MTGKRDQRGRIAAVDVTREAYMTREVVAWAAQECEWQRSGEMSVLYMVDGWAFMCGVDVLTVPVVQELGHLVEPRTNNRGAWRIVNVRVGLDVKLDARLVPSAMERLLDVAHDVDSLGDADEWFRQYEEIHPFRDGNGRTGNILWNWLRGTLDKPEMPPNLWNDPRR